MKQTLKERGAIIMDDVDFHNKQEHEIRKLLVRDTLHQQIQTLWQIIYGSTKYYLPPCAIDKLKSWLENCVEMYEADYLGKDYPMLKVGDGQ